MNNLNEQILLNGLRVTLAMNALEDVTNLDDFDKLSEELDRRLFVWRGSLLCRLITDGKDDI